MFWSFSLNWSRHIIKKLKIGFLASGFVNRHGSGTGKHFAIVSKILCTEYDSVVEVTFFCNDEEQYLNLKSNPDLSNANLILLPSVKGKWLKSSRQYFKYAFFARKNKIDVLHFSVPRLYPFFWKFPARKFVCTFHAGGDIRAARDSFVLSREIYNLIAKFFFHKLDAIIAVSEFGKNEISTSYGIPNELVKVMHGGTDDVWNVNFENAINFSKAQKKLIVVVGRWQKYKNIHTIARAIVTAKPSDLEHFYFVFIGKKLSYKSDEIMQDLMLIDYKVYEAIDFLNEVNYVGIIAKADLVIVPSLNEGFSHPIFDAFSYGTRLLIHNHSPASQILNGKSGVLAANLSDYSNVIHLINKALTMPAGNLNDNRDFLKSIGATWECLTQNYLNLYDSLFINQ